MKDYTYWIKQLGLKAHPEGGYYKETYRSSVNIGQSALPDTFKGDRSAGTAIYFLLTQGNFSAFHRIASDEIWHFYTGQPLRISILHPEGSCQEIKLGPDPGRNEVFQAVVPAGAWFGSQVDADEGWSLVGCTVAPGFDFADFEMAERNALLAEHPQHADMIYGLTR